MEKDSAETWVEQATRELMEMDPEQAAIAAQLVANAMFVRWAEEVRS